LLVACDQDSPPASQPKPAEAPRRLAGIYPEDWKCSFVTSDDALAGVLGGPVHAIDTPVIMPRGVPHPCTYIVDTTPQEQWTYDVYCRDDYKTQADALFAQYKADSADAVQRFHAAADAGQLKNDAGIVYTSPDVAAEVAIGAKGLDHHGRGLIFVDDDAPCYVRVIGIDPQKRIDLSRLVAKNLTFANAPMTPRPFDK
jgi:hypothetical protein